MYTTGQQKKVSGSLSSLVSPKLLRLGTIVHKPHSLIFDDLKVLLLTEKLLPVTTAQFSELGLYDPLRKYKCPITPS